MCACLHNWKNRLHGLLAVKSSRDDFGEICLANRTKRFGVQAQRCNKLDRLASQSGLVIVIWPLTIRIPRADGLKSPTLRSFCKLGNGFANRLSPYHGSRLPLNTENGTNFSELSGSSVVKGTDLDKAHVGRSSSFEAKPPGFADRLTRGAC